MRCNLLEKANDGRGQQRGRRLLAADQDWRRQNPSKKESFLRTFDPTESNLRCHRDKRRRGNEPRRSTEPDTTRATQCCACLGSDPATSPGSCRCRCTSPGGRCCKTPTRSACRYFFFRRRPVGQYYSIHSSRVFIHRKETSRRKARPRGHRISRDKGRLN